MLQIEREGRRFKVTLIRGKTAADVTGFYTTDINRVTEAVQMFMKGELDGEAAPKPKQGHSTERVERHDIHGVHQP